MVKQEPVAWMYERLDGSAKVACGKMEYDSNVVKEIPLYTAPRDLSDEEINKLWTDSYDFNGRFCVYEFARAILKKASEK